MKRTVKIVRLSLSTIFVCSLLISCGYESAQTLYTAGFSDKNFSKIKIGATTSDVQTLLGPPMSIRGAGGVEEWTFSSKNSVVEVGFSQWDSEKDYVEVYRFNGSIGVPHSLTPNSILKSFGQPDERKSLTHYEYWQYSKSPTHSDYKQAGFMVNKLDGRVYKIVTEIYYD